MKFLYPLFFTVLICNVALNNKLQGQTSIPVNTLVSQDFNGMTTGLTLPSNWRISAAGAGTTSTWATGLSSVTQASNSGSPVAGGAYNWGTTAGTDRAVGFMTDGGYPSPNAVMAFYRNTTGAVVSSITINFAIERYRINTGTFSLAFFSSTDGSAWTARTAGDIGTSVFATGASAYTFSSPQTIFKTVTITGLTIPNNGDLYFRWVFTNTGNINSQGLGLDNVSLYAGTATPVMQATLRDALSVDNGTPNQANPGDELRYTTTIKNIGSGDANNVVLTAPAPANTTLVPGSVKTSSLARDESYTTTINTALNITAATGVLTNDFGIPSPTVASFGPSANSSVTAAGSAGQSDNGGTLTVNADGSFNYSPPSASFTGIDKFSYKATNGNAPDNDAIVTITVGAAPAPVTDAYSVIGNVQINPTGAQNLLANDGGSGLSIVAVNGSAANVGTMFTTGNGSNITVSSNGDLIYNPGPGFDGPESFTYTVDNGFASPQTATVNITITGMVWFINRNGANGDGRLTTPFNSIANFNSTAADQANDNIFVYESAGNYDGSVTLLNGQRLIGQDATVSLSTITGLTPNATYSLAFPVMNATAGQATTLTTIIAATNAINLGSGNTIRGLTVGATTGSKIAGNAFGTVTIGDNTSPDVTLNGAGQALSLNTGAFSATTGLVSVTSTSSTEQGISLTSVTGPAGTVSFGSTTISGSATQGILVSGTTANINFGNTVVTSGTDGVTLQNNSAGTRTFGTLSITVTGANAGFLHTAGGGLSVAGVTNIACATGNGINISNNTTAITFGATTITKSGSASNAINIANTSATAGNVSFSGVTLGTAGLRLTSPAIAINNTGGTNTSVYDFGAASIFTNNAVGLSATNVDGTINMSSGMIDATGGSGNAIFVNGPAGLTTLGITLATVNASGGTNNVSLVNCAGTATLSGGTLAGTASGATFNVSGGSVSITYSGGITQANNAAMVSVASGHSGTITFNTGTLNATNGTGLQFDNADGTYNFNGTTTLNGGDAGIDIINGSNGTFSFNSTTSITNPSGTAININTSTAGNITYSGTFNKTSVGVGIAVNAKTGGTVSFNGTGTKTLSTSTSTAINLTSNTGGTIDFSGNNLTITTTTGTGFNATGGGTISVAGTVNTISSSNGIALNVQNTTISATGLSFRSISAAGSAALSGIILNNTGASGGLSVTGNGAAGTGGTIQSRSQDAISLTSTSAVNLSWMNITANTESGILCSSVTGLNLTSLSITNNGDDSQDEGIRATNLWGSCIWTNLSITASAHSNIFISNTSGTLSTLNITGGNFSNLGTAFGSNSILVEMTGTAILTSGNLSAASISNNKPARGITVQSQLSGQIGDAVSNAFVIQNCSFVNNGLHASFEQSGTANLTFKLLNNGTAVAPMTMTLPLTGTSHAVNVFSSSTATSGTIMGTISGNYIGNSAVGSSGSPIGNAIRVFIQGKTDATLLISNNTIRQIPQARGIDVQFVGTLDGSAAPTSDVTITGNDVNPQDNTGFPAAAIYIAGDSQSGGLLTLRCDVRNNTVPSGAAIDVLPTFLIVDKVVAAATVQLVDNPVGPGGQTPTQQLQSTNTGSSGAQAGVVLITGPISLPW